MFKKLASSIHWTMVWIWGMSLLGGLTPAWAAEELTFAMLPQITNAASFKKWEAILKEVEKNAGIKIVQVFAKDFDEHTQWCLEGKVSIAYSNPVVYAQMAPKTGRQEGHVAFAMASTPNGTKDLYGLFITRADNTTINTLKDLKGKRGMITGWTSAGGFTFQKAFALDQGLDLAKDCTLVESEANKQEKVVMAVYNQDVDFGTIRNGMLKEVENRIDLKQIRVLAETPRYPAWVLSAHTKIKAKTLAKISQAFLNLPANLIADAKLPGGVNGFAVASDKDFDEIRQTLDKVGMKY